VQAGVVQVIAGRVMTMPHERTRALLWAGGFLIELARDENLPIAVRQRAVAIARHFPTIEDVSHMAMFRDPSGLGVGLEMPSETAGWAEGWVRSSIPPGWRGQKSRRHACAQHGAGRRAAHDDHRENRARFVYQALVNLRALMERDVLEAACEQAVS